MSTVLIGPIGIVSPVGLDATTTCASIRAGVSRSAAIPGFRVLRIEDHENVPLNGHAVPFGTDGFAPPARWIRLARLAFSDLMETPGVPPLEDIEFWRSVVTVLVTPDVDSGRFFGHSHLESETIHSTLVKPLFRSLKLPPGQVYLLDEGRVGVFRAIASVDALLDKHRATNMLLLAVDSYLDGFTLEWLTAQGRLKSDANPVGLAPGESAVALLLSGPDAPQLTSGTRITVIGCALGSEERTDGIRSTGTALAAAITEALTQASLGAPFTGDLFTDLNGEAWRAHEFGGAQVRVSRHLLGEVRTHLCAVSVGDTGAASGALNIALGTRALERKYALGSSVLVVASSYDGDVAGAILQRME